MNDEEMEMHFDCYWSDLQRLARKHGERVADRDAWREPFDEGQSAEKAFYGEFPEHKPEDVKLVQVGPCACSDHECGECMQPTPSKVGASVSGWRC